MAGMVLLGQTWLRRLGNFSSAAPTAALLARVAASGDAAAGFGHPKAAGRAEGCRRRTHRPGIHPSCLGTNANQHHRQQHTPSVPPSLPGHAAMDPFVQLLVVVLAMAVGTMAFGSLPLFLPLGQAKLRYVELVGSGLLLGASFTIVIPEGVGTVLRATDALRRPPAARPAGSSEGSAAPAVPAPSAGLTRSQVRGWAARSVPSPVPPSSPYQDSRAWQFLTDGETVIGTMLLLGFFLMFV